jgi:hypothetical protein
MCCATEYARGGVNQMWILKKFKRTTRKLKITSFFSQIYSIKTYDFATLYTFVPHDT